MKVYVAAPWVRKADAIKVAEKFTAAGFTVISRWFYHSGNPNDATGITAPIEVCQQQAKEDFADVCDADCVVVLNLEKSEGKAVETGIALAVGVPFICIGPRSNVFHTLGCGMFSSVDDAITFLQANPNLKAVV